MARLSRFYLITVAAPVVMVFLFLVWGAGLKEDLQNIIFDGYQRLSPRVWTGEAPVRIIDIDDESLAQVGQWPWPRTRMAEIVRTLADAGAAAIAFDVVFAEPDRMSLEELVKTMPDGPSRDKLADLAAGAPSNDSQFAEAVSRAPVVLGVVLTAGGGGMDMARKFGLVTVGDDPTPFLTRFPGILKPLAPLEAAASGLGALNWAPRRDQVVRQVPVLMAYGDRVQPTLSAEALRVAQSASTYVVRSHNASGEVSFGAGTGINQIRIGAIQVATGGDAEIRIRYSQTQPGRFIPAWRLLSGQVPPGEIDGRIILIGTSAAGLVDIRATPVDPAAPGVEVHAQLLENMILGQRLVRPDWANGAELVLAVALAVLMGVGLPLLKPAASALFGASGAMLTMAVSWFMFLQGGILLDPILPLGLPGLVFLGGTAVLLRQAQAQRKQVRDAFGRFVSPAVVAQLADSPEKLVLGGETRQLTLMFCDLRDFTSMSEGLDAQGITRFMNDYLTPLTDEILGRNGTVDKYMGDAIMAFWNAPLDDAEHAANACRAALSMMEALKTFNAGRAAVIDVARYKPARFGIGIATGDCSVGNLGSVRRFDYSAIGDPVNLASRIEGITKLYGMQVLVAESTHALTDGFAMLLLDEVRVMGRVGITRLYTILGDHGVAASPDFIAWRALHDDWLAAYRTGDLPAANLAIEKLEFFTVDREERWPVYFEFMLMRLADYTDSDQAQPWSAVRDFTSK